MLSERSSLDRARASEVVNLCLLDGPTGTEVEVERGEEGLYE
jgi:hypothetical protein